jgi:large subunit ribosomal protein L18
MSKTNTKRTNWLKKKVRTRKSLGNLGKYPRLIIFRSNKHIYGQLVDDNSNTTILSSSSKDKNIVSAIKKNKNKIEQSKVVGSDLAEKIKKNKIDKIIYDRNGYRFHGRVKVIADTIKENGVKI